MSSRTIRLSLRSIARFFPEKSPHHVYLHGKWRAGRGKGPTLPLANQHDPKNAFTNAEALVGAYWDQIRRIPYSRQQWFWSEERVAAISSNAPVKVAAEL